MNRPGMQTLVALVLCSGCLAQSPQDVPGNAPVQISNDRLVVTILRQGATIASIVRKDDPQGLNPLWQPEQRQNGAKGHFVCVDGFGGTSPEEAKAGLPGHGEAIRTLFDVTGPLVANGATTVTLTATLPLVQERVVRSYQIRPGENVIYVRTRLESLASFDRPISWAEHATIGSPFLERGVTAVDQSGVKSRTRPWQEQERNPRTLASGVDFTWPNAPLRKGGTIDLRAAPAEGASMDHSTTVQDRAQKWAWVAATNPKLGSLIAWVWRTADFPWLQNWQSYPASGLLARGLEFSTQPWDIPRRDAVGLNPMFDTVTFRWLPARSAIETSFVILYTAIPDKGMTKVSSIAMNASEILVNGQLRLPAADLIP